MNLTENLDSASGLCEQADLPLFGGKAQEPDERRKREMESIIDLDRLIDKSHELAPFPGITVRLVQLLVNPNCNLADVVEVIAGDQALTGELLRAANSVLNASAVRVTNVLEAINRLGASQVMSLAAASGARIFEMPSGMSNLGLSQWRMQIVESHLVKLNIALAVLLSL
jgi:HD-like signal output (HDOD) protein